MIDSRGIEYAVHNGRSYYNQRESAKYLGMTDTGFRRRKQKLEAEDGIIIPLLSLPVSDQMRFVDKRVLDALNQAVHVGEEEQWKNGLRRAIQEANSEIGDINMAYPPRAFPDNNRFVDFEGKKEPLIVFGDFDGVLPVSRGGHTEDYAYANGLLNGLGYKTEDFDKEVVRIHKNGVEDPIFCDTAILVGLVKGTVSSNHQSHLRESIEHAFTISDYARAARNVHDAGREQWERSHKPE